MLWSSILFAIAASISGVSCYTATPLTPQSVPLAVRTPYLSTWLAGGTGSPGGILNNGWATFWQGKVTGWIIYARIDGKTYNIMGAATNGTTQATQISVQITATQSIYVMRCDNTDITVNFLSPIEPTDLLRQSLPFSYVAITVNNNDNVARSVQLYTDVSLEWLSDDRSSKATWTTLRGDTFIGHSATLQNPTTYLEKTDQVDYGSLYYATNKEFGVTHGTGPDKNMRSYFIANGNLNDPWDFSYRAINDNWPVLALSKDLEYTFGTVGSPWVVAIGHARDPVIKYRTGQSTYQDRHAYWTTKYASADVALKAFIDPAEYTRALAAAQAFDSKLKNDATSKVSADYATIVALAARQAFSGIEITVGSDASDIMIFLKEISSDGNVNSVDVVYPHMPILVYTNVELLRYILAPILTYQRTGVYKHDWSVHDIGARYPNAIGHDTDANGNDDEHMPLEESANMIIMALTYAKRSGNNAQLTANYDILTKFANYLVGHGLTPSVDELATDDFASRIANQTNLAIKSTIGIDAFSQIATRLGKTADASNFAGIAASYATKIVGFATSSAKDHLTLQYGNDASWGLTYNLYAQKLLGLSTFPTSVFTMQTNWYSSHMDTYGIRLDTRGAYTKSDWEVWTAAILTSTTVRDQLLSKIKNWLGLVQARLDQPQTDYYYATSGHAVRQGDGTGNDANGGGDEAFRDRPVVGGHFAFLALP